MNNPGLFEIEKEIEIVRAQLNAAADPSNLLDPQIVSKSQYLDELIVKQMKLKKEAQKNK